jgi:hypothetical protein
VRSKDEAIALKCALLVQHKLFAVDRILLAYGPVVTVLKGLTIWRQNEFIGISVFRKEGKHHFIRLESVAPAAEAKAHPSPQQGRGPPPAGLLSITENFILRVRRAAILVWMKANGLFRLIGMGLARNINKRFEPAPDGLGIFYHIDFIAFFQLPVLE